MLALSVSASHCHLSQRERFFFFSSVIAKTAFIQKAVFLWNIHRNFTPWSWLFLAIKGELW